jgi:DNA-binding GntR family transcriptional regulator
LLASLIYGIPYSVMTHAMDSISAAPMLVEQVYQRLRAAITDGSLAPGQRVRQGELAENLGVSRAPISHALHLLKHQGLVIESGRRGVEIAPLDPDQLRDVYQIRAALDSLASRLLAQRFADGRVSDAEAKRLDAVLAAGDAIQPKTPLAERAALDVAFHQVIYGLCGNPTIEETLAPLWPHIQRAMNAVMAVDEIRTRAWREHAEIVRLVRAGDAEGAASAAWSHAANAGSETEQRLRQTRPA